MSFAGVAVKLGLNGSSLLGEDMEGRDRARKGMVGTVLYPITEYDKRLPSRGNTELPGPK